MHMCVCVHSCVCVSVCMSETLYSTLWQNSGIVIRICSSNGDDSS